MNSKKDFVLLITCTTDNDTVAERTANAGRSVIHHKLCYVPIYKEFDELKKIQLKLRGQVPVSNRKTCAIIDISEWAGHENEEYFIISLKFFHDMCHRMRYVFTVGELSEDEARSVFLKLRCYLNGTIETDRTLTDERKLASYLVSQCIEEKASRLLSQMLMREELKQLKTIPIINAVCRDLRLRCANGTVGTEIIADYLADRQSLPSLVSPETAKEYAGLFTGSELSEFNESNAKRSA